jgi:3-methyladenine DNA glycosylase AlkD
VADVKDLLSELRANGNETNRIGMARYGINVDNAYGVSVTWLRQRARSIGRDHQLALELWSSDVHEARVLASIIDEPKKVTREQMDHWVNDFDSWDICDQCCSNLFSRTDHAREVIGPWCEDEEEFVRRAGFVMIAVLAVKDKKADGASFRPYLELIERHSHDGRNNVKKAVNWALRQIGKRDLIGHVMALPLALRLSESQEKTARWIGKDAVRELRSEAVMTRLERKKAREGS